MSAKDLFQGVERAGPDIAKDNAERTERKGAGSSLCSMCLTHFIPALIIQLRGEFRDFPGRQTSGPLSASHSALQ
jgi:hypothetical protein